MEDLTKEKRSSLPKIDTHASLAPPANDTRPRTLEDRILNSFATSLSISPRRLRESLSGDQDEDERSAESDGPLARIDRLTIQTKVLAGSRTLADVETKVVPASAHSMAAEVVEMDAYESGSEEAEEEVGKEVVEQEYDSSSDDDFDMRSASIMIAPEKIHRASRMDSIRLAPANQDFDKHVRMPSLEDAPPMPTNSFDKPEELELFLGSERAVSKVVILRPRAGAFEEKLVACLTLTSISPNDTDSSRVDLVPPAQMFFAGTQIATIEKNLRDTKLVDAKAIPEVWIPLDNMPMVPETDKIDRRKLRTWVQNVNSDTYDRVMSITTDQTLQQPASEMEREVQKLVARILLIPQEQVGMNFTFASLGGNEVTAMALVTNARVVSIFLDCHEILQNNNTLAHLAVLATQRGGLAHKWTAGHDNRTSDAETSPASTYFDLSPMQKLYFNTDMGRDIQLRDSGDGSYRFNSSLLFRVGKGFSVQDISAATDAVVGHHAMLRARFANVDGKWVQRVSPKVAGSYAFTHYTISTNHQVEEVVQNTQASINVETGPVFAVAHFQTTDGHQMIYVAAHHLVVDVASWRLIIQDMDELLQHGSLSSQRAMPFQKWTELQKLDAQMHSGPLPFELCPGDLDYWGMLDSPNTYADADEASFSLSEELTSILETTCNQVLRTESVDIYISALLLSFAQTFTERRVPDVWNQEYGRDLWNSDIDISQTVGWFTSLCPLNQQITASSDFIDVLRRLKDTRRAIPHRGVHYFANKFFSNNDRNADADSARPRSPGALQIATRDWPIEVLFSYAGNIQNIGRENGVLEQLSLPGRTLDSRTSDIGPAVGRIALFEVNTTIDQGSAKIEFLYNRHSRHVDLIKSWITNYEHLLLEAIGRLRFADPELTLADIPQLWATGVTYEGLTTLNRAVNTELGLSSINEIEAVYPVTPVQQSILISQARSLQFPAGCGRSHGEDNGYNYMPNPTSGAHMNACHIHVMYEFTSPDGAPVDLARVVSAWDQVVAHHSALRTVFIESVAEGDLFNAVVLKRWAPNMLFLDATPSEDPVDTLNNLPPLTAYPAVKSVPRHRLTVCHSPMKTVVKLDVSAALCDMMSVNAMIADLRRGYVTGRVTGGEAAIFSFPGYLDIMRNLDRDRSMGWWRETLAGVTRPCLFPRLDFYYTGDDKDSGRPRRYDSVHTELPEVVFQKVAEFCRVNKTTTGTVLRLAWGLVLRAVTGSSDICFGYRAPGRSATLEGMRSAVGCFANTIPVSFALSPFIPLAMMLRQIEDGYNAALPHQHITMAEIRHALCGGKKGAGVDVQLFNTCFAFTEEPADLNSRFAQPATIELRNVMNHETTDNDLTINTRFSNATGRLVVDISHSILSETQAHNIANTFARAVTAVITCASPSAHIGSLDLFSDRDYAQVVNWTTPVVDADAPQQRSLLHDLVFAQSMARPDAKAVCAHDGDLTYLQIEVLARRLAHVLLEAGVVPKGNSKAAVPVVLDKSKWAPIALLAILKAGAAFVPVDADEMGFVAKIAEQLGPAGKVAVTCAAAAEALEKATEQKMPLFDRVVCLDDALMRRLESEVPTPGQILPSSKPEDVACVFFTPTSSRSVRGISFTHASLSTCFLGQGPACGINNTTRVLQLSSFNVDVAMSEVFATLVHGGAMCIPTSRDRYNDYTGCVTRFSANWSYMTPLLARKLNVELLPTLKTVCFRTRGLDEDTYEPWRGRKRVIMAYGAPDVCPLGISFLEIHGPHHLRAIGRPVAGSAWIVSSEDHRNLMPVGAVGEMVIEGPTLGKTFRRSSLAQTDDGGKELPDTPTSPSHRAPFVRGHQHQKSISTIATEDTGQGKKRYYKTGHSVRYIENGLMEYVSSKRDDLEINGRVVNLAELEQRIRRALGQGVDVMVEALAFKGERGRAPTLAAFLELGGDDSAAIPHALDMANLSDEVKQRLYMAKRLVDKALSGVVPDFMIPNIFIPVHHLPTTYSLKVNRRKLQKVIKGLSREQLLELATVKNPPRVPDVNGSHPLPVGSMQARIRTVWAQVLRLDEDAISLTDGFLKVGGDEVSAAEVVARCRKESLLVTVSDLMRDVSLDEICRSSSAPESLLDQASIAAASVSQTGGTLDRALDSAIESMQQLQQQPNTLVQPTSPVALTHPAPQVIDRSFIDEVLAPKLLLEPEVIRDVAEATSTQIRHIETAMLTQGQLRSSPALPHGPGLADMTYFVFHFTAPSSTNSISARRIEEVCHILASIHPIMRTAFIAHVEGQNRKLYQVVLKNHKVDFKHVPRVQSWRLSATLEKEIKRDREALLTQCDLFASPITKFIFLDAGKTSTLVLRLSKAQYDDCSIALLIKDLKKLYDGGANPPRRPGFADFVREAALAHVGGEAERYWRGLLDGAVPTQVVRHTRPPKLSSSIRTLRESVSVNTAAIGSLGLHFDTVLKAAWAMVLATVSGSPDVVFGEVVEGCHSRMQQHLGPSSVNRGGVLGPTSTVLPVRIRFAESPTSPLQLLNSVADQRTAGMPYENLGMLDIVEKCTPWPYWTRLSTVVQHRTDAEMLMDGKIKSFRLGAALCKINVVESDVVDVPDFLVRSLLKNKSTAGVAGGNGAEKQLDNAQAGLHDGDEELEVSVSFCEQRVPANLAQEVLHKVCGFVGLLTGVSIMQSIVPTAPQYSALAKIIPVASATYANSSAAGPAGVTFDNPFNGGSIKVNFSQLEAKMSPEQMTTIQATIEDAWRSTLDPRTLGVPEEHVTSAAFYDLWGSLIPAAQLADYITDAIPSRLVGELSTNLFGNNLDGFALTMEEIVDNPTMLDQFQLIIRKAFGGEGRDRPGSIKTRSNSLANSVRKSNSLTNIAGSSSIRSNGSQTSLIGVNRAGTVSIHGPSKLGHARTRSDSTGRTVGSSIEESTATSSAPVFPAHPAVAPPINQHPALAGPPQARHARHGSDASSATATTTVTAAESAGLAAPGEGVLPTPPTSVGSPDPSELPGSAAYTAAAVKRSDSVLRRAAAAEASPESPILGSASMTTSPPVVQTGFVAARKKSNFGFGSSLRRIASNALRPGLQNHHGHSHSASSGLKNVASLSSSSGGSVKPPRSSGSDRDSAAAATPPLSPWVRVQSMAPQLPPFSPFTPVTDDAFSLNDSVLTSSDGQRTGASPDPSQERTSRATSPDLVLLQQHADEPAKAAARRISGTLVMHESGEMSRESLLARGGAAEMDDTEVSWPSHQGDEEEEDTLRAEQVQELLASAHAAQQPPQDAAATTTRRAQQLDQQPSPSPVTETFYMEDDEGSDEEQGEQRRREHEQDQAQYDSYEEYESSSSGAAAAPATPRQNNNNNNNNGPGDAATPPRDEDNNKRQTQRSPRYSVFPPAARAAPPPAAMPAAAPRPTGTDVQDFATLEAAEMDDTVSPLTPVERAMLYKQQGGIGWAPRAVVAAAVGVNHVGAMTSGSYFPAQQQRQQQQQQQQMYGPQMGGFHAI